MKVEKSLDLLVIFEIVLLISSSKKVKRKVVREEEVEEIHERFISDSSEIHRRFIHLSWICEQFLGMT